jgi:hypothetical protein
VLDKGVIVQAGKYDELLQAGTNFNTLVSAHNEALDQHTEAATEASFLHNPEIDLLEAAVTGVEASSDGDVMRNHHHHQNGVDKMGKQLQKQISNKTTLTQMGLQKQSSKKENDSHGDAMRRQLIEEEEREKGDVNFNVYWSYITSVNSGTYMTLAMLCQTCFIILQIGSNFWMAWASPSTEGDMPKFSNTKLIWVYACLSLGSSLFIAVRSILICLSGIFIAQKYFLDMIRCIFRAPMSFFDSTPTGRILNRVCMPIPLVSFVPIFFKTSSIVKCYKFFQIVMASSFSYTHLHLEQSAGKKDFSLKTNYIMNSLSF